MSTNTPESFTEQLSRVRQMTRDNGTWDLSTNDIAALRAVLQSHAELYEALTALLELGRKDTSNPKYDGYYATAAAAIAKAEGL